MPWRVGIDEAGYGPNLGPLVMTAVACRVSEEHADGCLWRVLGRAVRRQRDKKRLTRLLVDDSKLVYSTARGLAELETSVLAILGGTGTLTDLLGPLVDRLHADHELRGEAWYRGAAALPLAADAPTINSASLQFRAACESSGLEWRWMRCMIVCSPRFNEWTDRWGSKAAVLSVGLTQLLPPIMALEPSESVTVVVDKHGGRNFYGAMLQEAFPDCWTLPREEGLENSLYEIKGLDRPCHVRIKPRADGEHFEVALASMISKYIREALMAEFNEFWRQHVPDLEPTAGYPGDSQRFLEAIRPALARLQIAEELVWRKR
jgi:ribonuclease HII